MAPWCRRPAAQEMWHKISDFVLTWGGHTHIHMYTGPYDGLKIRGGGQVVMWWA